MTTTEQLTDKQARDLRSAFVCQRANGFSSYTLKGSQMRWMEARGWAQSVLGCSVRGGSKARYYRLTVAGLDAAERLAK